MPDIVDTPKKESQITDRLQNLRQRIDSRLATVEAAIAWTQTSSNIRTTAERRGAYDTLTRQRRELKRIKRAIDVNPSTVLFGESQKGKSYLITSLLGQDESSLMVVDGDKKYNFKTDINPEGHGIEATGIVTRFTTSTVSTIDGFPVKLKMLSAADVVMVLADSYFSDLRNHNFERVGDFADRLKQLEERFLSLPRQARPLITEDDMMEIGRYIDTHFHSIAGNLNQGSLRFFARMAALVEHVPAGDYPDLFSTMWYDNQYYSDLYTTLMRSYAVINYAREVFVPYSALLREDRGGMALIDVKRLHDLYEGDKQQVQLRYMAADGRLVEGKLDRSSLSALTSEVVCSLPKELEEQKEFLKVSDILDFPGWRSRLNIPESQLDSNKPMPQCLLRGKVAYFFFNYSDNKMISTLLLCHDNQQTGQADMPDLIYNWLRSTMCTDNYKALPDKQSQERLLREERGRFLETSEVAPLFIIMTKFNLDLRYSAQDDMPERPESLVNRWKGRFDRVLQDEVLASPKTYQWFNEWTPSQPYFNNIYLLRDFYFSSQDENNIFSGWTRQGGKEQKEVDVPAYPDFRQKLRQTFLDHPFVKDHFADPAQSWNDAATVGNDGTKPIIAKLSKASPNIYSARLGTFEATVDGIDTTINSLLNNFYHTGNEDDNISKAKAHAARLSASLSLSFSRQRSLFGYMIEKLQVDPIEIYNTLHYAVSHVNTVNHTGADVYSALADDFAGSIVPGSSKADNLKRLVQNYFGGSKDDCRKYFDDHNLDLDYFITGSFASPVTVADILTKELCELWNNHMSNANTMASVFFQSDLDDVVTCYTKMFARLDLQKRLVQAMQELAEANNPAMRVPMVADVCAELLNNFVADFGATLYDADTKNGLAKHNQKTPELNLNAADFQATAAAAVSPAKPSPDELCKLFQSIDKPGTQPTPSQKATSLWLARLRAAIMADSNVPDYDEADNNKLKEILNAINNK